MGRERHQPDYGELFQLHLAEEIEHGGYPGHMIELVEIYQRKDEAQRCDEFERWVRATGAFPCTRCGYVFTPPAKIAEDAPVLCATCR